MDTQPDRGAPQWAAEALDAAPDAIFTLDAMGAVVQLNRAAERLLGPSPADALGVRLVELVERLESGAPRIGDQQIELDAKRADGTTFCAGLTLKRTSADPPRYTGFVRDLSEQRAAELRRPESERVLVFAEELASTGSWELDLETGQWVISRGAYRLHELAPGELDQTREGLLSLVHEGDRDRVDRELGAVLDDPAAHVGQVVEFEYRAARNDGPPRTMQARGRVLRGPDGRPTRWAGTERDVTSERLAERRLQAHDAVAHALREWDSVEEGTVALLRRVGEALGCPMGALWVWGEVAGGLVCRAFWQAPGVDGGDADLMARRSVLRLGEGTPGMAWSKQSPLVGGELSNPGRAALTGTGLHPYVAIPAMTADGPVAVLAFYGFDAARPPDSLIETLADLGLQLGRFLAPRRGQLEPQRLSPREIEVLRLAAGGNTGPEIAAGLGLSVATVKTHFENIYDKLGVKDRGAAVAHGLRTGLIN